MGTILDEEYATVPEAATLLGVSQSTIWRWIDQGLLPAYRFGRRRVLVKRSELSGLVAPVGEERADEKHLVLGPLMPEEQRQMLAAVEQARRLQGELLRSRSGRPFPSSAETIHELRAERARDRR